MRVHIATNTGTLIEDTGSDYELLRDTVLARVPDGERALWIKVER